MLFFSDIVNVIPKDVQIALFADDLCIWHTSKDKKEVTKLLQKTIDLINEYCKKFGFSINKSKTSYTTFTSAGYRENYPRTYGMQLHIDNCIVPLEPFPCFLGITLDPKLNFKLHLEKISKKLTSKINLIKRFKALKIKNRTRLCTIIFKNANSFAVRLLVCHLELRHPTHKQKHANYSKQNIA